MEILKQIASILITPILMFTSWIGGTPNYTPVDQPQEQVGAFNVTGGGTYRVKSSIGSTDASINLSSFKEPVSDLPYTMTYLSTTIGYGTIEPQTTRSEFISFTGITQNSDGTAVLTGVTRGLTRTPAGSGCTASTTLAQRHPAQSIFILSDSPCVFAEYAVKRNNESVTGAWTFPEPTANSNPATKYYVDNIVTGGLTAVDKLVVTATAGEAVAAGNLVYQNMVDGEWYKVDYDLSYTVGDVIAGIAQGAGTNGVNISGGVMIQGLDANQSGLTIGATYFASTTAGSIGTATTSLSIGKARTATNLYVVPNFTIQINPSPTTFTSTTTVTGSKFLDENSIRIFPKIDVYTATTSTHTWTKPTGAKEILILLVGGGAGGRSGESNSGDNKGGYGGGSGAVILMKIPTYALPSTLTVTVGDAGKGGVVIPSSVGGVGGWGKVTQVGTTTVFAEANGGVGGDIAHNTQATTTKYINWNAFQLYGGVATLIVGSSNKGGGGGGGVTATAGSSSSGNTGGAGGAATDPLYYGAGGSGANVGSSAVKGLNYGGGGGGGFGSTSTGGNGADGAPGIAVIITFF